MTTVSRRFTPVLFVLLGALWGSSFVFIDIGLAYYPPILFAAFRYDIAGVVILGYAIWSTDDWIPRNRGDILSVLIAGLFLIAGHHAFLYLGQQYITGAVAAVVISLGPVLTTIFASLLLTKERLSMIGIVGLWLGLVGTVIVADVDPSNLFNASTVGIGLAFLATVSFSLGAVLTRPVRTSFPAQSMQAWAMLVGAPILHAVSLVAGETPATVHWSTQAVGSLAYLGIVSGALAFLLYFTLLDALGPIEINLIGYLEPVCASVLSWLLLDYLVDAATAVGFICIFIGFALVKHRQLRSRLSSVVSRRAEYADQRTK